jgi:hypothetical protein
VQKILEDEETIDLAKTAEAILQREKWDAKKKLSSKNGKGRSLKAYQEHLIRKTKNEEDRQDLIKALNKKKD